MNSDSEIFLLGIAYKLATTVQDVSIHGPSSPEWEYAQYKTDIGRQMALSRWLPGHFSLAKILELEPYYLKIRVLEAIWIKETNRNSNLDCALVLNQTWLPYFEWMPHFSISHSLPSIKCSLSTIINSCLYQPIYQSCIVRILLIQLTKVHIPCTVIANFYAMLSKKDLWITEKITETTNSLPVTKNNIDISAATY